jgi:hypothetical protein
LSYDCSVTCPNCGSDLVLLRVECWAPFDEDGIAHEPSEEEYHFRVQPGSRLCCGDCDHTWYYEEENQAMRDEHEGNLADEYGPDDLPEGTVLSTDVEHDVSRIIGLTLDPDYVLYTQVDVDSDEDEEDEDEEEAHGSVAYVRGWRLVDRTGVYAWVPR